MEPFNRPRVGVGVIIVNQDGQVLVGKRKGSFAQKWAFPGGSVEMGHTFEATAIREIKEETNLDILDPKVIAVVNGLETYKEEGKHYVSVILLARKYSGELKIMEPEKCEEFIWVDIHKLPEPLFDASRWAAECYLKNSFYEGIK
ncbi:MAG: NUDIX domain-containing protein [Candidatus Pacebacteria bacterium]|nr:NUDIX domain-containing protein [Candidatus Paceibacterota bacterium]